MKKIFVVAQILLTTVIVGTFTALMVLTKEKGDQ